MTTLSPAPVGWSFLRSRRWIGYYALLVIFSIACVWFGNWQFDRRAEARAEINRIDNNYDAAAIPLAEAMPDPESFDIDALKWQSVEVTGEYIGEPYLARNRPGAGGVGSNLIHPFQLTDGSIFFIDRGWVPVTGADEIPEALPMPAEGEITVTARLRSSEPDLAGRDSSGRTVASIYVPELARLAGAEQVYNAAYGQVITESVSGETGVLPLKPVRDEGPHLSYALQWYVFILIGVIGVIYAARQEFRGLNAGSEAVAQDDARRADKKRKRGPTDADYEDAFLDR